MEVRWKWEERAGGGWNIRTREADGQWRERFWVQTSGLMKAVVEQNERHSGEPMWGLYAARDFKKGEKLGVYVGEDIGEAGRESTSGEVRRPGVGVWRQGEGDT